MKLDAIQTILTKEIWFDWPYKRRKIIKDYTGWNFRMWSLDALKRWLYQRGFLVTKVKQLKVMGTLPGAAIGDHKTRFHFILVRGHDHGKVKYKNVYKSSTFYV